MRLRRILIILVCLLACFTVCACDGPTNGEGDKPVDTLKDDTRNLTAQEYSVANLTAIDEFGRLVEICDNSNPDDKYVGLFYFAWLGSQDMAGIYDVDKLERENPDALYDPQNTTDSRAWDFHFTSEPLYGYYSMRDPWVINRHVELFTMAGVDYVIFDYTNARAYNDVALLLLNTLRRYKDQGWDVPKVSFYTNSSSAAIIRNVYNAFYINSDYDDLWFRFAEDDRPVIIGISSANQGGSDQNNPAAVLSTETTLYNYFNFYESQWPSSHNRNEDKGFPWMQWGSPIPHLNGNASVSVAQHSSASVFFSDKLPNSSRGYDGQNLTQDWRQGANFQWQWDEMFSYADRGLVRNVFVTGWNEWTAIKYPSGEYHTDTQRWLGIPNGPSGYTGKHIWMVDDYNAEYSRDVEMGVRQGDGFYLQLTSNLRRFKFESAQKYRMKTKTIDDISDFKLWNNVFVEYADFVGDAMARDGENAANVPHSYIDNSNRNDIAKMKVTHDDENLYFYIETADDITAYNGTDKNWMNILLSVGDTQNSFAGFNYIVNRSPDNGTTSVERYSTNGWVDSGSADYYVSGNKMVCRIALSTLGLTADNVALSFKVADNVTNPDNIMDYYCTGDSAPIGRFGYGYGK